MKLGGNLWIGMGPNTFDDLDYADDFALHSHDRTLRGALLERIDEEAGHLGLHVSRANSKVQIWSMVVNSQHSLLELT